MSKSCSLLSNQKKNYFLPNHRKFNWLTSLQLTKILDLGKRYSNFWNELITFLNHSHRFTLGNRSPEKLNGFAQGHLLMMNTGQEGQTSPFLVGTFFCNTASSEKALLGCYELSLPEETSMIFPAALHLVGQHGWAGAVFVSLEADRSWSSWIQNTENSFVGEATIE